MTKKVYIQIFLVFIVITISIGVLILYNINKNSKKDIIEQADEYEKLNKIVELDENEISYQKAVTYINNKDYTKSIKILTNISDYKDSLELLKESYYNLGIKYFDSGDIVNCLSNFEKVEGYKETDKYIKTCKNLDKIIGTYMYNEKIIMFSYGWTVYENISSEYIKKTTYKFNLDNNTISINNINLVIEPSQDASIIYINNNKYNKISNYVEDSYIKRNSPPEIGMTKQQVLESKWGEPKSKLEDEPNTGHRLKEDDEETFYYIRGTTKIMVNFKNGKVESFSVIEKGDKMSKIVYDVSNY